MYGLTVLICTVLIIGPQSVRTDESIRVRRQASDDNSNSILTVEWEGLASSEGKVKSFAVEYRPATSIEFIRHTEVRFEGPNYKYHVKIKNLPSGVTYIVRILVLGEDNRVLLQTPEITAVSTVVHVKCDGSVTEPRSVHVVSSTRNSIAFSWQAPQCGNPTRYLYRLESESEWATYDRHEGAVGGTEVTISNLLPGTQYRFLVLAVDDANQQGPWSDDTARTVTGGEAPPVSDAIRVVFRTDSEILVEWEPIRNQQIQYYQIAILEESPDDAPNQIFRTQVSPTENSFSFSNLKSSTNYLVGVVAYAGYEPTQVFRLRAATYGQEAQALPKPTHRTSGMGKVTVQWELPIELNKNNNVQGFIILYRLPNETNWHRYGSMIKYNYDQTDYTTELSGFNERSLYIVRIYVIDRAGNVVGIADDFTVGKLSPTACTGVQGVPPKIEASYVDANSVSFSWQRPTCDERYGPVEGYEYLFWSPEKNREPEQPLFTSTNRVRFDKLLPNTKYSFRCRSLTRSGSSPWSNPVNTNTKSDGGLYKLRVVLSSSTNSYLVWTPIPQDRGRIRLFNVSHATHGSERWHHIEGPPERFRCPENVGDPGDYCYDLSSLQVNIQHTAKVVYQLDDGSWSQSENPLFFLLVPTRPPIIPATPIQLTVIRTSDSTATATWLPPLNADVPIDEYKITLRVLTSTNPHVRPGSVQPPFTVGGNVYRYQLEGLYADTVYNVSVVAGSRGYYGPPVYEIFGQDQANPDIRNFNIESRGSVVTLSWEVAGPMQDLCCFEIDLQLSDSNWRMYGGKIPVRGDNRFYTTDISGLEANKRYSVRIRGISHNRKTLCTGDALSFNTHCEAPSAPPDNIQIKADGSSAVELSWTHPDRQYWGCEEITYVIEAIVNGVPKRYEMVPNPLASRIHYRAQSEPGADWQVRLQTKNKAGSSPLSNLYTVKTDSEAYISKPRLTLYERQIQAEWVSQGRSSGKIAVYRIQYRNQRNPQYVTANAAIPFNGDNRPYNGVINDADLSSPTYVRVAAFSQENQMIAYSPEEVVESRCSAPSQAPSHVQLEAPNPRQVLVRWQPPRFVEVTGCDNVYYEIRVLEPSGYPAVELEHGRNSHLFDARPNQRWIVEIRLINSAGATEPIRSNMIVTPSKSELIIGLTVSNRNGVPMLIWRSVEGVDGLVDKYRVEIQDESTQDWRPLPNGLIDYVGAGRQYEVELRDLPEGRTVYLRVVVIDPNNGIAYTSPHVTTQVQSQCRPPASYPRDVRAMAVGANQIRLMWRPLLQNEWNCDIVEYEVVYNTSFSNGVQTYRAHENQAIFDSQPRAYWKFKIRAVNRAGSSQWSPPYEVTSGNVAPGPVERLVVSNSGPARVYVSWNPPANAAYQINEYIVSYRLLNRGMCGDSNESPVTRISTTNSYTIDGLHPHSRYQVSVAAKTNVQGQPVVQEFQTEPDVPIGYPRAIAASDVRSDSLTLVWQSPACIETNGEIIEYEYQLQGLDDWATQQVKRDRTKDSRAVVDGLKPFTSYSVQIRAYSRHGPGPWSSGITVTTEPAEGAGAPQLSVLHSSGNSINLLWLSSYPPQGQVDLYKVQFEADGTTEERDFRPNELHCPPDVQRQHHQQRTRVYCATIANLSPGRSYDFQVKGLISGRGWSAWSNKVTGRTGAGKVIITLLEAKSIGADHMELVWDVQESDRDRVEGFKIMAKPLTHQGSPLEYTIPGQVFQTRIDRLQANSTYNVTILAKDNGVYHNGRSNVLTTTEAVLPSFDSPPRIVRVDGRSITVEWNAPYNAGGSSISGYAVEYRIKDSEYVQHHPTIPHDSYKPVYTTTIDGLSPNTQVFVRIRLIDRNNRLQNPGPETPARTDCAAPILPPQTIRADSQRNGPFRVVVKWERPPESSWNCDRITYVISFRSSNKPEEIVEIPADQTEYSFSSAAYTNWNMKMQTKNRVGASRWSSDVSIITPEQAPGMPRDLRLTPITPNEVEVSWAPPAVASGPISGYDISYKLKHRLACPDEVPRDVSLEPVPLVNVKGYKYLLKGLLPYAEYEVSVQARTTEPGPPVMNTVRTLQKVPSAPPLDLKIRHVMERQAVLTWEPIECSQRNGPIKNYEFELHGLDDWAKYDTVNGNTSLTEHTVSGLIPYTKYAFRVKGYNEVRGGPATTDLEFRTEKAEAPKKPQDLRSRQEGHDFIAVWWLPPYPPYGHIESYHIRYRRVRDQYEDQWISETKYTTDNLLHCGRDDNRFPRLCYNMTNLASGTAYEVQVAAKIQGGSQGLYTSLVVHTLVALPGTPHSISLISKTSTTLNISWLPPVENRHITQYELTIRPSNTPESQARTFQCEGSKRDYLFTDLDPSTLYNITLKAGTAQGFGPAIYTEYRTDDDIVPSISTSPRITDTGPRHLQVEWNGVTTVSTTTQIQGYILEYKQFAESQWREWNNVIPHDSSRNSYTETISGLEPDTGYSIRVKVMVSRTRVGAPSPVVEGRTGCEPPTSPPSDISLSAASANEVKFRWRPLPSSSWRCSHLDYYIEYKNGTQSGFKNVSGTLSEQSFVSAPYTVWTMRIRSQNSAGVSAWSQEFHVTTPQMPPGPPSGLICQATGDDSIQCSWKAPEVTNGDVTKYVLTYTLKNKNACPGSRMQPVHVDVQGLRHVIKRLDPDSVYEVSVRAWTVGEGPPVTTTATTEEAAPTGPPTNVQAMAVYKNALTFNWDEPVCEHRNGDITKYEYVLEGLDPWVQGDPRVQNPQRGSRPFGRVDVDKLIPYTRYEFSVSAINAKGTGPYSDAIQVTTKPAPPPAPRDLRVEGEDYATFIMISFLPPYPPHGIIDKYYIRYTFSGRDAPVVVTKAPEELACLGVVTSEPDRLCYRVPDLDPEKEYIIQVAGNTVNGGIGDWTQFLVTKTGTITLPVPGTPRVTDRKSDSITLVWSGIDREQTKYIQGYVLEYAPRTGSGWLQHNGIIPITGEQSGQLFRETVKNLKPDTVYGFQLRLVSKTKKRSDPGNEVTNKTLCGKPLEAPRIIDVKEVDMTNIRLTFTPPPQHTWRCSSVVYVIKYTNSTSSGEIEIDPNDGTNFKEFESAPATRWVFTMKTQTMDENESRGEASDWSPERHIVTSGIPTLRMNVTSNHPTTAIVVWEFPNEFRQWKYGVNVIYQLKQKGNCRQEQFLPATKHNEQGTTTRLTELEPYSLYEVTVEARMPSQIGTGQVEPPKQTQLVRTKSKAPDAPPTNVQHLESTDRSASFTWEPPQCDQINGELTQYEYIVSLLGDKTPVFQGKESRNFASPSSLQPGTRYQIQVRGYTVEGPGPWSDPLPFQTTGSSLGMPRELRAIEVLTEEATVAWLPPRDQREPVVYYRLKFRSRDGSHNDELTLDLADLRCTSEFENAVVEDNLCYTLRNLRKDTDYEVQVQAGSGPNTFGPWSLPASFKTMLFDQRSGGYLRVTSVHYEQIGITWGPPDKILRKLRTYRLTIEPVNRMESPTSTPFQPGPSLNYLFMKLKPDTRYNISVQGLSDNEQVMWSISTEATTREKRDYGCDVDNYPAPTDLLVVPDKTESRLTISWTPPEVFQPASASPSVHYVINVTRWDQQLMGNAEQVGTSRMVDASHNMINLDRLTPNTIYNISIQTFSGSVCGGVSSAVYSTLDVGEQHILWLKSKTPTSLHVAWKQTMGAPAGGYELRATALSGESSGQFFTYTIDKQSTDYNIQGLRPGTVYNVSLIPWGQQYGPNGVYDTSPFGHIFVGNLRSCDKKDFHYEGGTWPKGPYSSIALSWTAPKNAIAPSASYQVRYRELNGIWRELPEQPHIELRCPGDGIKVDCERFCYLLYNLTGPSTSYLVQVRTRIDGILNNWKTAALAPLSGATNRDPNGCCIVPPPWFVDNVGERRTMANFTMNPSPSHKRALRYHAVVDERQTFQEIDPYLLFDKVTALERGIPYYITASFDTNTLPYGQPKHDFFIGDGRVYGGYLNYPLTPGKKYNFIGVTIWGNGDVQEIGINYGETTPGVEILGGGIFGIGNKDHLDQRYTTKESVSANYIGGAWPWWWLLLLLLGLLLLLLLLCSLLWCCLGSRRRRKRFTTVVDTYNGESRTPLLGAGKDNMSSNLKALESRIDNIRSQLDNRIQGTGQDSRDGDRDSDTTSIYDGLMRSKHQQRKSGKGDFEEGYVRGFRDANKISSAGAARRRLDEDYAGMKEDFHLGYVKGLKDAGLQDMTRSMQQLATSRPANVGGYSAGYMQGFREGSAGTWGDKINLQMLHRLEEIYPNQDEFRQGYIDGYKEGLNSNKTSDRGQGDDLHKSLNKLTDRLSTLEHQKQGVGDEIHTTKIYHVYNQLPEAQTGYATSGQQLAHELEELSSSSRRSTLRRHYTPGDYLKYASDTEGGAYGTSSLRRNRRSLSASALGRDAYHSQTTRTEKHSYYTGGGPGGPGGGPGIDSGPIITSPLSTMTGRTGRSSAMSTVRNIPVQVTPTSGASTGLATGASANAGAGASSDAGAGSSAAAASSHSETRPHQLTGSSLAQAYNLIGLSGAESSGSEMDRGASKAPAGTWTDELMDIVKEPLEESLDRMKKYSTSLSKLPPSPAPTSPEYRQREQGRDPPADSYVASSTTYKEEYSSGQ